MTFEIELPRALESAATARQAVGELSGDLPEDVLGDVRLLVSELVTNALRHANLRDDERTALAVGVTEQSVRVEVTDHGRGFEPTPRKEGQDQASGWGLFLVERLAERWGVSRDRGEMKVWFELRRS